MRTRISFAATLLLALALAPSAVLAQHTLDDATHQLESGHAARARQIATTLIEEGTRTGSDLAPLYRVLGIAAATAGDEDAAREAFTRWLALEPEGRLDRSASDDVRSPFMEARGFWSSTPARLGATATLRDDLSGIDVHVVDPASLAARVRARVRLTGGAWADVVRAPSETIAIDVAGLSSARALDYTITFLDESGNRIWQDGTDTAPLHLEAPQATIATASTTPTPLESSAPQPTHPTADATPFHIAAVVLGVVAVGGIAAGAAFHADREHNAGLYNGDGSGCTGAGTTRAEVCGPQRTTVGNDEIAAGVLYGVGGAAAITAVVLAVVAPSGGHDDHAFACGAGPGTVGISCGGRF
jgi:hypothetical protein